jgi:ribonuclease Z
LFLFDAGENTLRNLESSYVPVSGIADVFITHWHSDHFNGLGGLINHSWVNGRKIPLTVYGPPGVEDIVASYAKIYDLDIGYRSLHFVPQPELGSARAQTIIIPPDQESVTVFDQDGVRIEAWRVAHQPVEPAYGYVVHYRGKKVFISGDTRVSDIYLGAMQDADLVVHEAINSEMIHRAAKVLIKDGRSWEAMPALHVTDYHADTLKLAEMAQRAGVKQLVLTHLIPAPTNFISRRLFARGMSDIYTGKLTVGEDGMQISLD